MERLTKRNEADTAYYYPKCFEKCDGLGVTEKCNNCVLVYDVCEKLGEYEGLEEQGLLLKLPIPIGTTVYKFEPLAKGTERYIKTTITRYEVFGDSIWFTFANGLGRNIEDFGKYVFLTQAEAEEKLKEMKQ